MPQPQADSPEVRALREATAGLEYPSESDTPFDVFRWSPAGESTACDQVVIHSRANRPVEQVPLDQFFRELEASEDGERFRRLREVLTKQLQDVAAFRVGVGETKVDVYLIGGTRSGEWVGLHTVSVET